jgi:hypothetical protein
VTLKFIRKAKRRNAGVYWYTAKRHLKPGRELAYVGESWDLKRRDLEHVVGGGRYKKVAKSWADLEPRRYAIQFPWWLSWKWVLRPVETLLIRALRPRYNWDKNPYKRHRVGPLEQPVQRAIRDARRAAGKPLDRGSVLTVNRALVFAGVLVLMVGVVGSIVQR